MNVLATSKNSAQIQAFPLTENHVNISTGSFTGAIGFHCVEDGEVSVTWPSGVESIACVAGDDYMVIGHSEIEVTSGTFHIM